MNRCRPLTIDSSDLQTDKLLVDFILEKKKNSFGFSNQYTDLFLKPSVKGKVR
jgi:hypothetical protein